MALFTKHSDQEFDSAVSQLRLATIALTEEQAARNSAEQTLAQLRQQLSAEQAARNSAEQTLAQLRQQLSAEQAARNSAEQTLAQLRQQLSAEQAARNSAEQTLEQLRQQLSAEQAARNSASSNLKDLQEENDLLLSQLHQVQEELERYFLKNKSLESSVVDVADALRTTRYLLIQANLKGGTEAAAEAA